MKTVEYRKEMLNDLKADWTELKTEGGEINGRKLRVYQDILLELLEKDIYQMENMEDHYGSVPYANGFEDGYEKCKAEYGWLIRNAKLKEEK